MEPNANPYALMVNGDDDNEGDTDIAAAVPAQGRAWWNAELDWEGANHNWETIEFSCCKCFHAKLSRS